MTDKKTGLTAAEYSEIFRWIIVIPVFAVLVLLAANFTIGFFKWLGELEGWLYYAMFPVALIIILSNALTSILACMIAPRKVSAVILLGIGYLVVVAVNYTRYDWASEGVFYSHAVMVYVGLFLVFYLDRLNAKEEESNAGTVSS